MRKEREESRKREWYKACSNLGKWGLNDPGELWKTVEDTMEFPHMKGKGGWHLVFKSFSSKG